MNKKKKERETYTSDDADRPKSSCERGAPGIGHEFLREEGTFLRN